MHVEVSGLGCVVVILLCVPEVPAVWLLQRLQLRPSPCDPEGRAPPEEDLRHHEDASEEEDVSHGHDDPGSCTRVRRGLTYDLGFEMPDKCAFMRRFAILNATNVGCSG